MRIPVLLRRLALGFLLAPVSACTSLERLAIPESNLQSSYWSRHDAASAEVVDHAAWQAFLDSYLVSGGDGVNRVRYGEVAAVDRAALQDYLAGLQEVPVTPLARDEQLAYWVNLYNARTVELILEHYPARSIRDITFGVFDIGPWSEPLVTVEGRPLSLHDIEHGIVRPIWRDARAHYVLNCAAMGCPNLARRAYRGATIDVAMADAARAYVNDPRGVAFGDDGRLVMSKIYAWYREDFGGSEAAAIDAARGFAEPPLAARLEGRERVDGYRYDWSLNDAAPTS